MPYALAAAGLFFAGTNLTGPAPLENGQPFALAASQETLPAALDRVAGMLSMGHLDISAVHEDTMISGRVMERLGQFHAGLPVFGGQVVRQMDGRSVVSVTGRLYDGVDADVTPSISP